MSALISALRALVGAGNVLVSDHGYDELAASIMGIVFFLCLITPASMAVVSQNWTPMVGQILMLFDTLMTLLKTMIFLLGEV